MKQILSRAMLLVLLIFCILVLGVNYALQLFLSHEEMKTVSADLFWQIDKLVAQSIADIAEIEEDYANNCLIHAKAAAYIAQYRPELFESQAESRKLAALLNVDEIHFFSPEGEIIAGTNPEYYGYTFNSGTQMQFFLPMLQDRTLQLCQDITPNTAEGRMMQYAAVWREDGSGIVQIGMEPERVLKETRQKSLSWVLDFLPVEPNTALYLIDAATGTVQATTNEAHTGVNAQTLGFPLEDVTDELTLMHLPVGSHEVCLVLKRSGEHIYARLRRADIVRKDILLDTSFLLIYCIILSLAVLLVILKGMDRSVIKGLSRINQNLHQVGQGYVEEINDTSAIPELSELTRYINDMLHSLRSSVQKVSLAIERSRLPIGLYEYASSSSPAYATSRIWDILHLDHPSPTTLQQALEQARESIAALKTHPFDASENVYLLEDASGSSYIHLEELSYEGSRLVLLIDATAEYAEREVLRQQRDIDLLTSLYNRRGFSERMEALFRQPERLGWAALAMIDADKLKEVNDRYGHDRGDRYLEELARVLTAHTTAQTVCARMGGDEFTLFLYGFSDRESLERTLNDLSAESGKHLMQATPTVTFPVQFSMGYAVYPAETSDYHQLIRLADERMYQNKRSKHASATR